MANRYAVETVFKAVDAMTAPLKNMEGSMKNLTGVSATVNSKIKNDMKSAERQLDAFGNKVKNGAKLVAAAAVAAIGAGFVAATKQYIEFDNALHSAGAAFSDIDASAANFEEQLKSLGTAAREVAAVTEFNAKDTADALATLARAGVQSNNAIALLPGVADLATAACVSLNDAVGMAVGGLNVMGLMTDDPVKLGDNMKYMADVMAYTADSANMSLVDVSEAINQGGNFFKTANNNLETFSASLTALAMNGIAGAEAGVHLRNIMTNLSAPTAKASKALAELGINTTDAEGNLYSIIDIVGQFQESLDGMGDAQKNEYLYNVFGKQNIAAFNALMNAGSESLNQFAIAAGNSFDAAGNKANAMRQSISNQIEVLKSGLTELGFKFVEAFREKGSNALQSLINWIQNFDPTTLINALVGITDAIAKMVQIVWALRVPILTVVGAIALYKTTIMGTVVAMKAWNAIQTIIKVAQIAWVAITQGTAAAHTMLTAALTAQTASAAAATTATGAMAAAEGTATAATTGFNLALLANPITWIVLAVIALIGVIILLATHWDQVTAALKNAWQWISNVASIVWDTLVGALQKAWEWVVNLAQGIWEHLVGAWNGFVNIIKSLVEPAINAIWTPIKKIIDAFSNGGILAGIKQIGVSILKWMLTPLQNILTLMSKIPGIGDKFAGINENINNWLSGMEYQNEDLDIQNTAPVTTAERYSYSQNTTTNNSNVTIGLEKGITSKVSGPAPGITITTASSGAF